jgi:hypothetical protein
VERPRPDVVLQATPYSVSSLKSGGVSLVFHVGFDDIDAGLEMHKHLNRPFRLELFK